jgi:hypothetical protein
MKDSIRTEARMLARASVAGMLAISLFAGACHSSSSGTSSEVGASSAPNQLSRAERSAGWQSLFDGRSLAGWRGLGYPGVPAGHWTVEDGTLRKVATAKVPMGSDGRRLPGGDLMTVATFKDFELEWDWKMSPAGNSGLKYNVSEELSGGQPSNVLRPATGSAGVSHSAIGFEYQMIDDDRHSDGKLPTHRSGALYDLITPDAAKVLKPIGEWNHSRIVFNGMHGEHWLNGVKVVEYELGSPAMATALKASKFRSMPWYGERRTGHIVLQDHGDDAWFRNMRIRELKGGR